MLAHISWIKKTVIFVKVNSMCQLCFKIFLIMRISRVEFVLGRCEGVCVSPGALKFVWLLKYSRQNLSPPNFNLSVVGALKSGKVFVNHRHGSTN